MSGDQDSALLAMNTVVDAYEMALGKGVPPATLATAAVSSALGLMVQIHGEEVVAKMIEELPAKIRRGDFTHKT
jgi:TctA family transporter